MRTRRIIVSSLRALAAHKVRGLLAVGSVAVGVAAVLLTSALGAGAEREMTRRMDAIGTNLLVIRPAQTQRLVARKTIRGEVTTLTVDDYEAIARLPYVAAAAPGVEVPVRAKSGNLATMTKVLGTSPAYPVVRNARLGRGRFLDGDDDRNARRVAVLGARVADTLFPGSDPLGREIRIRSVPFEVVGVLDSRGVLPDGSDEDNQILVPLRTALRRVANTTWLTGIFVSVDDPRAMSAAAAGIRELVRTRHGRDDFDVQNTTKFVSMQKQVAGFLTRLGTGLGAVALLVGGTGILALMLTSVRERTPEIGLRMAIGATAGDVVTQFLIEGTLLTAGGWLGGLAISAVGAVAVAVGTEWTLAVPADALLASAVMVVVAGIAFGALPARKASRIPPIVALQSR